MKWINGLPSAEAVAAHETEHGPRRDGVRLPTITVGRVVQKADYITLNQDKTEIVDLEASETVFGEWIVIHRGGALGEYIGVNRLKAVNGEVLYAIGFCQWGRLSDCVWGEPSSYFPVGPNGLPLDYESKGEVK